MLQADLTIIVPAHNEEQIISSFISKLTLVLKQLQINYLLLIIENGSTDNTNKEVQKAAKNNHHIKLIQLEKPSYGEALLTGLKLVKSKYAVIFNVDFWDERLLMLTKVDLLNYDLITGSKLLPGSVDIRPFNRRLISLILFCLLKILFGYHGTDTHGIKAIRMKNVIKIINNCKTKSGIVDSEIMIRAQKANLKIMEIPVTIEEIRTNRFGFKRFLQTPRDLLNLYFSLR